MKRDVSQALVEWKNSPLRKPLILRGARQVGKTWIVENFSTSFDNFVEINFEEAKSAKQLFIGDLKIQELLPKLMLYAKQNIIPGKTLLFFDEIQACEEAITALRYFKEDLPELHVIAAGSLLDFALDRIGVPVGRVQFMYLYPLSFGEFLTSCERQDLRDHIKKQNIDISIHKILMEYLKNYLWLGGMPAVVDNWIKRKDVIGCQELQDEIIEAYKQDFAKYAKRQQIEYVEKVFQAIPTQLGQKFKFAHIDRDIKSRELKEALNLLVKAKVAHICYHSSGQEQPLGASKNNQLFKIYFLDVGLAQRLLNLSLTDWVVSELDMQTLGCIAEQFVAQELAAYASAKTQYQMYYWHREEKNSSAEVDFLTVKKGNIIPIEVKAGTTGTLKSMHLFLASHPKSSLGLKISADYHFTKRDNIQNIPLYGMESWMER